VSPGAECQDDAGRNDNRDDTSPLVRLKALYGPGDHGEPMLTVMRPDED
jgi:hypothetical protein